jgi:hypothetical protein
MKGSVKRPHMKRYPKKPKQGATLASWENYRSKCTAVEKDNTARMSEYNKAVAKKESDKKKKEKIIKSTTGLSGIAKARGSKKRR